MFNLTINHSPDAEKPNQACYQIPADTPMKVIVDFFEALGLSCYYKAGNDGFFLDLRDCKGNPRGWILLSGSKEATS